MNQSALTCNLIRSKAVIQSVHLMPNISCVSSLLLSVRLWYHTKKSLHFWCSNPLQLNLMKVFQFIKDLTLIPVRMSLITAIV